MADLHDELARHHVASFGWALACCKGDRVLAEDVLQTTYLKIVDGRARYGGIADFRAFLFGVIRRTAAEERRRRAVRSALSLGLLRNTPPRDALRPTGTALIERDETTRALGLALAALSRRQREVLHLVFYQDLTIADAARVMGVSLGSARIHYERGKTRLRHFLADRHHHDL